MNGLFVQGTALPSTSTHMSDYCNFWWRTQSVDLETVDVSSVVLLFGGTLKCVSKHISQSFLPTGSYVAHSMRMTISSMFFVLIATPLVLHGGSCFVVHSDHPPHIVTRLIHLYHANIPWISMPLCGFRGTT